MDTENSPITLDTKSPFSMTIDEKIAEGRSFLGALDRMVMEAVAIRTGGASTLSLATASFDWLSHFALLPGTQITLACEAMEIARRSYADLFSWWTSGEAQETELPAFEAPIRFAESFTDGLDGWIDTAVHSVPGVSRKHRELVGFAAHQMVEPLRPENFLFTNREALKRTREEAGANLLRGWNNFVADGAEHAGLQNIDEGEIDAFVLGENLAATPGKVVFRNRLIELIQYKPTTEKVHAEPVLITPAWIMKYYILDLSQNNSLVRYLTEQGFTVFMISWKNPDEEDHDLTLDDYRQLGVLAALEAVNHLVPKRKVHTVGYCLGGTLLTVALAALSRDEDPDIASVTLLAAQVDFEDAGELTLFIDEDQLSFLEASMEASGYLDGEQMAAAFSTLRSRDLLWRRWQRAYLLGEKATAFDLMAWNQDTTRMPPKMHSEYLRKLYLDNDLVNGRFMVDGRPVAISDIRVPIFALGTEKDHVAPWRSVFKIHLFADTEVTFCLTNGGHNAGVVSEVGRPRRRHRLLTKPDCDKFISPEEWLGKADEQEGSWWPSWSEWLVHHTTKTQVKPPAIKRVNLAGNDMPNSKVLLEAPGSYVFVR